MVFNTVGNVIIRKQVQGTSSNIDLTNDTSGIYFIKVFHLLTLHFAYENAHVKHTLTSVCHLTRTGN